MELVVRNLHQGHLPTKQIWDVYRAILEKDYRKLEASKRAQFICDLMRINFDRREHEPLQNIPVEDFKSQPALSTALDLFKNPPVTGFRIQTRIEEVANLLNTGAYINQPFVVASLLMRGLFNSQKTEMAEDKFFDDLRDYILDRQNSKSESFHGQMLILREALNLPKFRPNKNREMLHSLRQQMDRNELEDTEKEDVYRLRVVNVVYGAIGKLNKDVKNFTRHDLSKVYFSCNFWIEHQEGHLFKQMHPQFFLNSECELLDVLNEIYTSDRHADSLKNDHLHDLIKVLVNPENLDYLSVDAKASLQVYENVFGGNSQTKAKIDALAEQSH